MLINKIGNSWHLKFLYRYQNIYTKQTNSYKILYKKLQNWRDFLHITFLSYPQVKHTELQMLQPPRQLPRKRQSSHHVISQLRKVTQVMDQYTNRSFLQQHSLYSNLFSSQSYSLAIPQTQQMNLFFGKQPLETNELYEYSYFHKRDKKLLLFFLILKFLKNQNDGGKSKMVVMENIQVFNKNQLKSFVVCKDYGGSEKLVKDLQKRNVTTYKFNLSFLSIMQESDEFLKCLIVSDINSFESSDKLTHQRYYKRLPKDILIFSFRRDVYDYKVIQKSPINQFYAQQHGEDKYQLNDKVTAVLKKKYQTYPNAVISFLMPIQYLGLSSKNIEETYKTCLIRITPDNTGYLQFTFKGLPFTVENLRKITT